ncbi:TniQ family protein [Roseovarius sp. M141]|uniref:TniQ family protein n=1 Tax=Roseovarius sp. M141 TaxID=2583806 RepID=UPI003372354D|nr:TniQ family protein [Roseovarius sp. M141]
MPMLPVLPPYTDETTVSWCARVARFHTGMTCADFLKMVEISQADVMGLNIPKVDRLSNLTGVPSAQIMACGPQYAGDHMLTYKGETFGTKFMTRNHTTYCPACLLDDRTEEPNGERVGRLSWMFAPVRVCPRHGIFLTQRKSAGYPGRFQDMNIVAPSDQDLAAQIKAADEASVSGLQSYVVDRLSGKSGPCWLDAQDVDQAAKTCQRLGLHRIHGAFASISSMTIQKLNEAEAAGFEAASQGLDGIYSILDEIVQDATKENRFGGVRTALGEIYISLRSNNSNRDAGPLKDVVRDFIIEHLPVEPGSELLDGKVAHRKRHNVASLSKVSGIHQKTLNRALVQAGVIAEGDPEQIEIRRTFDAVEGEALAHRINNSTPTKSIPGYLNCNRTQAQMMVRTGILKKLSNDPSIKSGVMTNVANDDLDDFLVRFRAAGKPVQEPSAGMVNTIEASEVARVPVADIVRLVLDGRLATVETGCEELRFRSVFVRPEEIRPAAQEVISEQGLSPKDAAKIIGIPSTAIEHLRTNFSPTGQPFLQGIEVSNARGTIRFCYARDEVERFCEEYVTLQELADDAGTSTKSVGVKLTKLGIEPIMNRHILKAKVFRRGDL